MSALAAYDLGYHDGLTGNVPPAAASRAMRTDRVAFALYMYGWSEGAEKRDFFDSREA